LRGGLPHSEIPGSTIARISPGLFAACHVLHRLSVPRHPPDALHSRFTAPHPTATIIVRPGVALATPLVERCPVRGLDPRITRGPPMGRQSSLHGGTGVPPHEDTIGTPRRTRPFGKPPISPATQGSRLGHTTRLFTSVHQQFAHRHPKRDLPEAIAVFSPRIGSVQPPVHPPGVEVNGFEPMTSCLQSRRSPS
jgi:hypothetical protein